MFSVFIRNVMSFVYMYVVGIVFCVCAGGFCLFFLSLLAQTQKKLVKPLWRVLRNFHA